MAAPPFAKRAAPPSGLLRTPSGKVLAREPSVARFVPYTAHVDAQTIATRDGALLQILELEGLRADAMDAAELGYRKDLRDLMVRSLGSSEWALTHHAIRTRASLDRLPPPRGAYAAALDGRYRAALEARGLLETRHYLTLLRRPLQGHVGLIEDIGRWLARPARTTAAMAADRAEALKSLHEAMRALIAQLDKYGPRLLTAFEASGDAPGDSPMNGRLYSAPMGVLSTLVNAVPPACPAPPLPEIDLAQALPARRLVFRRERVESRGAAAADVIHTALLSIKTYPPFTAPGQLDRVLDLPHAMTLSQSFALLDRDAAIARIRGVEGRLRGARDSDALSNDLAQAVDAAAAGRTVFGAHHLTIAAHAATPAGLDRAVAEIASTLAEAGIVAVREDLGLEAAYWAQLPGNFAYVARKAVISSANFAAFACAHGGGRGAARSHWGPPLAVLQTWDGAPYRFHLHHGDLGNATVIGPSGSGKSVLLGFLIAQSSRIAGRRAIVFDKDRGLEIAVRALGGRYHTITPGRPAGLNPFALADTPATRAFLVRWLARLAAAGAPSQAERACAQDLAIISDVVEAAFEAPPAMRRLGLLAPLFEGHERQGPDSLAARMRRWHGPGHDPGHFGMNSGAIGQHAWLFDTPPDEGAGGALDLNGDLIGFDLTAVLDDPDARTAALMALFFALEESLDGRPTLIVLDEGWRLLDDPVFEAQIKDWQKTVRKKNAAIVFATQSAEDAARAAIGPALIEQAPTQIFFPNLKADARVHGDGFGLTAAEIEIIRTLSDASRAFLIKQSGASRVVRLDLGGLEGDLAILSGRTASVRALDRVRARLRAEPGAQAADDPETLIPALLAELGS